MDAFKKECDLWMLAESVSVYQVLNVLHDDMFKRHRKGGVITVQVKDLISSSGLKILCAHYYHALNILLWGTKYGVRKQFCSSTLEGMNWKFLFPQWEINYDVLQVSW